jgi:aminopeptidase N
MRRALPIVATLLALGCGARTDHRVPPPPKVHPSFKVEVPAPRADGRLPSSVRPLRYGVTLRIDPAAERFHGEVLIDVATSSPANAMVLHALGLQVSRAEVIVGQRRIAAETTSRPAAGSGDTHEELVVIANSTIPAGQAQLHLEYDAPLDERPRGIYRVREGGAAYVFTQFEPADARRMLPSFDEPNHKVPFDIEVVAPTGNAVFGNAPLSSRAPVEAGWERHRFQTTRRLPTYLLALAVGPLEVREGPKQPVPIRVIATPGKTAQADMALEAAAQQLSILSDYFGSPYPYAKLDLVAAPNLVPGAMENAGLVTFREELLLVDGTTAPAKTKRMVAMTMAHELAHHWFGNLVTMRWWNDLWLNEGFATFMEAQVVDRWRPAMAADRELLSLTGYGMELDGLASARAVRQPVSNVHQAEESFGTLTYVKGAAVIEMLHAWLGDEPFRTGVSNYLRDHAWGNASASDMFAALSKASGRDVAAVASTFLDQPGVPLVTARVHCEAGKRATVELRQQRYWPSPRAPGDAQWNVPVCLEFASAERGASIERRCSVLRKPQGRIELGDGCPAWINPNADYRGYYRVALERRWRDALAGATRTLDTRHKVGFLANGWAMVQAGHSPATALLDELLAYRRARDREVLEAVVDVLLHVNDALVEPEARVAFQRYVKALLLPAAKRLGWTARKRDSEDDRLLRRSLLEALALLVDDRWMTRQAKKQALAYLKDPRSVDSDSATVALQVSARAGVPELAFDGLAARLANARGAGERITLIQALASYREPAALERTLAMIGDGRIRAQDSLYVFRTAAQWPSSRPVVVRWMRDNFESLAGKLPVFGISRMLRVVGKLCDGPARSAAATAFGPLVEKVGASDRRLQQALESSAACIELRAREADRVGAYLKRRRRW